MSSVTTDVPIPQVDPLSAAGVFRRTRKRIFDGLLYVGGLTDLGWQTIRETLRGPLETDLLIAQFDQIGVRSLSIVGITSLFIGMVLALQTAYSLEEFGGKLFIGKVVSLSLVRELGPPLRRTLARERSAIAKVARENSRSNSGDEQAESPSVHAAARGLQLAEQLNQPARLGPANLHPYRLKLKELRYVLELEEPQPARQELIDAIKKVQDAIGEWHDWMSLGDIAADVLDHDRCRVIAQIKATAASRFANALAAAQSLRSRYAAKSPSGSAPSRKTSRKGGRNSNAPRRRQKLNALPVRTLKATAADIA